jgi:hypothetical protein
VSSAAGCLIRIQTEILLIRPSACGIQDSQAILDAVLGVERVYPASCEGTVVAADIVGVGLNRDGVS